MSGVAFGAEDCKRVFRGTLHMLISPVLIPFHVITDMFFSSLNKTTPHRPPKTLQYEFFGTPPPLPTLRNPRPKPQTLNPKHYTLNPETKTLNPDFEKPTAHKDLEVP